MFHKISKERYDELQILFNERLPKSARIQNVLVMQLKNIFPEDFETSFYSFKGELKTSSFVISVQHFKDFGGGVFVLVSQPTPELITEDILNALENFINWSIFHRFEIERNGPMLNFINSVGEKRKNYRKPSKIEIFYSCAYQIIPPILSDTIKIHLEKFNSKGILVKQLQTEDDINHVNRNWGQNSVEFRRFIKSCVNSLPSGGVFIDERSTPVSWGITTFVGTINALATDEEYRGQGYAKGVTAYIAKAQIATGLIPCARIVDSNTASHIVFQDVGYTKSHECYWVHFSEGQKF